MRKEQRHKYLLKRLKESKEPVPGHRLAGECSVSRQIIVQDLSVLKAAGHRVVSTCWGYVLENPDRVERVFRVRHDTRQIAEELYAIVDEGGEVMDVSVLHPAYGELRAALSLTTRKDVDDFVQYIRTGQVTPLKELTDHYHFHTVAAPSADALDRIEAALERKRFLVRESEPNID